MRQKKLTNVYCYFELRQDEKHQCLTTQVWLFEQWYDEFMMWDASEFPNVKYLVVRSEEIWTPDIMAINALGDTNAITKNFLGQSEGVQIQPSGHVSYWLPVHLMTFCPMRMDNFPFDRQTCHITMASWIYSDEQLRILIEANAAAKRKSFFYIINLVLPCYLLSLIACFNYLLPPERDERISLLVTTFLAIVVFVLVVLEMVPEESDSVPLFSKFLLGVMLLNMTQIVQAALANKLHNTVHVSLRPPRCLIKMQLTCCGVTAKDLRRASAANLAPATYHDSPLETPTHLVTRNDPPLSPPNEPVWQRRVKDVRDRDRSYHMSGGRELVDIDITGYSRASRDVIRNNGVRETVLTGDGAHDDAELNEHDSFIPARHMHQRRPRKKNSFKKHDSVAAMNANMPTAIEEWRLIFLAFDKICFVVTTVVLSLAFWLMVTTKGSDDSEPRILAD